MKRGIVIAVGGAAVLAAGLSGCSSDKGKTGGTETTSHPASVSVSAPGGSVSASTGGSDAKVLIDGKDQEIHGTVTCATAGGQVSIAIGEQGTGIGAVLTDADPPGVTSVALGNVNGVTLGYAQGGDGDAKATKDGNKYKITGDATGIDMTKPTEVVKKPFEIDVTCP